METVASILIFNTFLPMTSLTAKEESRRLRSRQSVEKRRSWETARERPSRQNSNWNTTLWSSSRSRHGSGNGNSPPTTPTGPLGLLGLDPPTGAYSYVSSRDSSFEDISSCSDAEYMNWTEYTARRSAIKFRSRKSISRGSSRRSKSFLPPSRLVQRVLQNEYSICTNKDTTVPQRLVAVLYCWFYGWITDVYSALTSGGTRPSFFRWTLSSISVTCAAVLIIVLARVTLHFTIELFSYASYTGMNFICLIITVLIFVIGILAIVSYD